MGNALFVVSAGWGGVPLCQYLPLENRAQGFGVTWKEFHGGESVVCWLRHRAGVWLIWVLFSSLRRICCVTANLQVGQQHELVSTGVTGHVVCFCPRSWSSRPLKQCSSGLRTITTPFTLDAAVNKRSSLSLQEQARVPFGRC